MEYSTLDYLQKFVINISSDIDTVRWIEPYDVPISMAFQFMWLRFVIEVIIETALQGFLVWWRSRIEGSSI